MGQGMIGRKLGMIRLFDGGGRVRACTVIELGPNRVTQLRTSERDGYEGVQVGFPGNRKRLTRPARGHLRQAGVDELLGVLREYRIEDVSAYELGQELTVADFEPGQYVNVTGTSKGRGFAGVVKRWDFRGGPKTHGQGNKHRSSGSVGAGTTPGRTWRGQKMGGHMGARRKTVLNLLVVQTDVSRNLIFVEGSAPGPNSGFVSIGPARKPALAGYEPPPRFAVDEEPDDAVSPSADGDAEAPADEPEAATDENDGGASE